MFAVADMKNIGKYGKRISEYEATFFRNFFGFLDEDDVITGMMINYPYYVFAHREAQVVCRIDPEHSLKCCDCRDEFHINSTVQVNIHDINRAEYPELLPYSDFLLRSRISLEMAKGAELASILGKFL